ncbi:hypothetical protein SKAU_G00137350 [Synaphobranchus kaupii]|uniref:Uncharacterized protein n=1 Tax=Synaphobranchus kaupii TaxID=118154 RepID=A0A9Q1FRZ4_SYNKA|nr:hypothetical protein SKAU_G00137350 [Synaphobranchus kaupii]
MLQLLVRFLQPFKQATKELSSSNYPTINLVALWKPTLINHCQITPADPVPLEIQKRRCAGPLTEWVVLGHQEKLGVLL